MVFNRDPDLNMIYKLKGEELFKVMLEGLQKGCIFPAVRRSSVDFYYKGGNLFHYGGTEFSTNIKYASVLSWEKREEYIKQSQLSNTRVIDNFIVGLNRIKENCKNYAKLEAKGVSELISKFSVAKKPSNSNIVVLDIEIALYEEPSKDRIDILLFNMEKKSLRFYEVKHYSNEDLWSKENTLPQVFYQIDRYKRKVLSNNNIIAQYGNYIKRINILLDLDLPIPLKLDETPLGLLIFGYDQDQLNGRFTRLLKNDGSLDNIPFYSIGEIKNIDIHNLWKQTN